MKVAVVLRQVPDVVEELVIADDGRSLSEDDVVYITNEADDHALEEALVLKSRVGARVTALSAGGDEAKEALATAVAKGADEAVHVPVPFEHRGDNARLASVLGPWVKSAGYDLVLTGVWAADQMDAGLAGALAVQLTLPYVGGVVSVSLDPGGNRVVVRKEFSGGRLGVFDVSLPAVLGVQSAEQPPRYVPVSKVMATRKALQVRQQGEPPAVAAGLRASKLVRSASGTKAEMLPGDVPQVADAIVRILRERGLA